VVEATDALLGDAPDLAATTTVLALVPTLEYPNFRIFLEY
jgi:hypothetical protein